VEQACTDYYFSVKNLSIYVGKWVGGIHSVYAVVIQGRISYQVVGTDSDRNEAISIGAAFNNRTAPFWTPRQDIEDWHLRVEFTRTKGFKDYIGYWISLLRD